MPILCTYSEAPKNRTNLVVLETGGLGEAVEGGLVGAEAGLGAGGQNSVNSIEELYIFAYVYLDIGQADILQKDLGQMHF